MPWSKLDDGFADHPKVMAAGPLASWLYVCGLNYASRQLTDGFIPHSQVRKLADVENARELAERLVAVNMWEPCDGGYLIHDYLDYNPSREQVLATRKVRAEAGSKGGKQKASNLLEASQTLATDNFKQNSTPSRTRPTPVLDPVPDPSDEETRAPAALESATYPPKFEKFWSIWSTPPTKGRGSKKLAADEWRTLKLEKASDEALAGLESGLRAWQASPDWRKEGGRFIPHCHRWLKARGWEDEPPDEVPARASPNGVPSTGYTAAAQRLEQMKRGAAS